MKIFKPHPAALAFPLLRGDELEALKKSILERGQDFPAVIHEGRLLDGRNRQEAVRQLVVEKKLAPSTELKVTPFRGGSIAGFVRAANVDRRHLSVSQLAMIAAKLLPLFRKEAKERQAAAARATNRSKKRGQKALALVGNARKPVTAAQEASKAMGGTVSARSIERAEFVRKNDPALAKAVDSGEITAKQAEQKIRRRAHDKQVAAYVPPEGSFNVVTVDFSWEYRDQLEGDTVRGAPPYPPMKIEEIVAFIRGPLARCCDETACVLGNWITGPISLDLTIAPVVQAEIQALGFKVLHERIWEKEEASGADFVGLGRGLRWNAEKLQLYVRGDVLINETGEAHGRPLQSTVFRAPVGEHSEKPQRAYTDLERLFPYAARLEMFARADRAGWRTSGAELAQPPVSSDAAPATPRPAPAKLETSPAHADDASFSHRGGSGSSQSERSDEQRPPGQAEAESTVGASATATGDAGTTGDHPPATSAVQEGAAVWPDAEYECANCHATFVSREILSKHAKACGDVVSAVDAIAAGAAIIEVTADRAAVIEEVKRLAALKPFVGSPGDVRLMALEKALAAFRLLKRETRATIREREEERAAAVAAPADFVPPLVPGSTAAPPDDGIDF